MTLRKCVYFSTSINTSCGAILNTCKSHTCRERVTQWFPYRITSQIPDEQVIMEHTEVVFNNRTPLKNSQFPIGPDSVREATDQKASNIFGVENPSTFGGITDASRDALRCIICIRHLSNETSPRVFFSDASRKTVEVLFPARSQIDSGTAPRLRYTNRIKDQDCQLRFDATTSADKQTAYNTRVPAKTLAPYVDTRL